MAAVHVFVLGTFIQFHFMSTITQPSFLHSGLSKLHHTDLSTNLDKPSWLFTETILRHDTQSKHIKTTHTCEGMGFTT